jgi:hypothetical protein
MLPKIAVWALLTSLVSLAAPGVLDTNLTLQAKHFKAAAMLEQLAETAGIHLVLPREFPRDQQIASLEARDSSLASIFDSLAHSTHFRWKSAQGADGVTVTFEKE